MPMTTTRALLFLLFLSFAASCGGGDFGFGCPGSDPAPPDVSGEWAASDAEIASSTCSEDINQRLLDLIDGPSGTCDYDVDQDVNNVFLSDCLGDAGGGCVDGDGVITVTINRTSPGSCNVSANGRLTANAGTATSTALYALAVTFSGSGCGVLTDCEATVQTSWER